MIKTAEDARRVIKEERTAYLDNKVKARKAQAQQMERERKQALEVWDGWKQEIREVMIAKILEDIEALSLEGIRFSKIPRFCTFVEFRVPNEILKVVRYYVSYPAINSGKYYYPISELVPHFKSLGFSCTQNIITETITISW